MRALAVMPKRQSSLFISIEFGQFFPKATKTPSPRARILVQKSRIWRNTQSR